MSKPTSYELAMLATSLAEGKPDESHFEKAWDIYQRADTFRHNMQANPESDFIRSVIKHYQRGMIAFRHESDDECPVRQYLREKGRPMQQARTVLKNIELFSGSIAISRPQDPVFLRIPLQLIRGDNSFNGFFVLFIDNVCQSIAPYC